MKKSKQKLKYQGHQKIDRLVELGMPRHRCYQMLEKKMPHLNGYIHFRQMNDKKDLVTANDILQTRIQKRLKAKIRKQKEIRKQKYDILPIAKQKKLLKNLNKKNPVLLWIKKIFGS
jgi:hypothetical protein